MTSGVNSSACGSSASLGLRLIPARSTLQGSPSGSPRSAVPSSRKLAVCLRKMACCFPRLQSERAYQVFAGVFLELTFFEPAALPMTFPAIEQPGLIQAVLARDVDGPALLARTRPAGAPTRPPVIEVKVDDMEPISETTRTDEPAAEPGGTSTRSRRLAVEARSAIERGNSVRAAILWTRLAHQKGAGEGKVQRAAARAALKDLAVRLRKALFVQKGESSLWADALLPLLDRAAAEFWSPERRLLHDLQNVCLDHEREVFRLEPVGWITSLGPSTAETCVAAPS